MAELKTSQTTTYLLSSSDPALTIDLGVTVDTSSSTSDAIDGFSGATWSVLNYGALTANATHIGTWAVYLDGSSSDSVDNHGQVSAAGGVDLAAGGSVTNEAGATIAGKVSYQNGSNSSSISGVHVAGGAGKVYNYGSITSNGGYGVGLDNGGQIYNYAGASIIGAEDGVFFYTSAGYLDNAGQVTATVDDGVGFFAGGTLINEATGKISAQNTVGGYGPAAVYFASVAGTLTNYGSMIGTNYGAYFDSSETGCVVGNYAGALLQGGSDGVYIGVGTVTNAGTITGGSYSVDFAKASSANLLIVDPGAVFNGAAYGGSGALELAAGAGTGAIGGVSSSGNFQAFTTLKVDAGATWTLSGSGNTIASLNDSGALTVTGSLSVTSAESLTSGALSLSGGSFTDTAGLTLGAGGALTGNGAVTTGTTAATELQGGGAATASGGVLEFKQAVDQTGAATSFNIANGANLQFDGAVGTASITPNLTFQGGAGAFVATAAAAGSVHLGTITGFSGSDTIKLKAFATGDTYSVNGNVLTIANGANSESFAFANGTAMASIQVADSGGVDTTTINSAPPPSLGGGGVAATYTEGGAATTLDSGLTVSDPNSTTLSGATVSIASGLLAGDTLNFTNQSGISGSYNSAAGVLTLSGSASLAAYQTALDSVTFSSTSLNPTNYGADLTRAINWQVSDGAQQSAVVSSSVNVVGVDQAPVLSGAGNTTTYTAGGAAVAIDVSLAVSDPDNLDLASATVTISGNFQSGDKLNFNNQNGITGSYDPNSGVLTLSGPVTLAQYQAALDSVTFSTTSTGAASRTISWQVSDGMMSSNTASSTVNIVVPPTLGGAGVAATYTEGGAAATLDGGLTVSDPSSTTLSGATVSIATGLLAGDTLNFTNQSGISGSYNSATGALTLTGSASLTAYQTALDSVSFSSTSLNPTNYGADLTRAINWQVSAGSAQSAVVSSSVNVVGVDQAPVLSGAGNTTTYTAGGAAVAIDVSLAVSDADNLDLASATVTISGNFQSGDTLNFNNQNGITGSYDPNSGVLTLSGPATLAQYQTALDSVAFSTTSTNTGSRAMNWQVDDGTLYSAIAASTVAIAAQAPTLGGGGLANWAQAVPPATTSTPVAVDPTLTVADASSLTLSSAKVTITTGFSSGDQLIFATQNGISGSYNASTGVLTLSGTASPATYQAALDSIVFTSTNANPTSNGSDSARTVTWTATAGTLTSAAVTSTIDLGQTYKLTTSRDTINAGVGADTIVAATPSTINSTDSINGGGGSNTLLLQGTGSFNLATPKTLRNIENVDAPGVAGGTTSVTLRKGLNNLAIGVGSGVLNETFNVNAAGSTSDTFLLTPDFGALTISNFAATRSGHDTLELQASMFSYLTPGMTQAQEAMAVLGYAVQSGANAVITDSLGDKITLNSVSIATLTANPADFKFV